MSTIQADTESLNIARVLSPGEVAVVQALLAAQAPSSAAFLGMGEGLLAASFAEMLSQIGVHKRNIVVAGAKVPSDRQASRVLAELSTPIINDLSALLRDWSEIEARFDVVIIDAAACPQVGEVWFWRRLLLVCGANALVIVHSPINPVPGVRHTRLPGGRLAIVSMADDRDSVTSSLEMLGAEAGEVDAERWLQQARLVDPEIPKDMLMIQGSNLLLHPVKGRPNIAQVPLPMVLEGLLRVSAHIELKHTEAPPIEFAMLLKSSSTSELASAINSCNWVMVSRPHHRYPISLQCEVDGRQDYVLILATRLATNTETWYAHSWWTDIKMDCNWIL